MFRQKLKQIGPKELGHESTLQIYMNYNNRFLDNSFVKINMKFTTISEFLRYKQG